MFTSPPAQRHFRECHFWIAATIIFWISINLPASATQYLGELNCEKFNPGIQQAAPAAQLECFRIWSSTGKLSTIETARIEEWVEVYYTDVATSGEYADAKIIQLLVNELERRKPPRGERSSTVYSALLLSGELDEAKLEKGEKKLNRPVIDVVRTFRTSDNSDVEASLWTFNADYSQLTEEHLNLSKGPHIIVYSSPACGICSAMSTDLSKNVRLRNIFKKYSIWVEAPDMNFAREYYRLWDSRSQHFPMHVLFDRRNWPKRSIAATPYIFFVNDGKVVAEMIGWPPKNRFALGRHLSAMGL